MATVYKRTFTPGGKQVSTANQVIDFAIGSGNATKLCVQFLQFQTFAQPCKIKINNESTIHWIDVDSEIILKDIDIDYITIVDAGAEYYYTAMSTE